MAQKRQCQWKGCTFDLTGYPPNQKYCPNHSIEAKRKRKREWARERYGAHKTLGGRILLDAHGELRESISARRNKETYDLWNFWESLTLNELQVLVTKRKQDLKHEKDPKKIKQLRTEITVLNDCYKKKKYLQERIKKTVTFITRDILKKLVIKLWIPTDVYQRIQMRIDLMPEDRKNIVNKRLDGMTPQETRRWIYEEIKAMERAEKTIIDYLLVKHQVKTY